MKLFFYVIFAALALTTPLAPALGEDYARESVEEIVRNTEESFRSASSAREKAYVASVCKSRMARQSFPVRDKLRAEAESLISANAVDDAKFGDLNEPFRLVIDVDQDIVFLHFDHRAAHHIAH